uniref:Uncharacterized protein n=1 Tax=Heliothis virescens TaxID=7102 RepID=A0A2A4J1G4_HELVI
MILITKLLFVVILAIVSSRFEVVAGTDDQDDDDILKQALFLVELLKSDFSQVLRSNSKHDPKGSSAEEANSTCGLDETNSTVAMYETEVTESENSSTTPAVSTSTPSSGSVTPPGVQMMMFSSWPPLPMPRFPMVSELARQGNFPDENYRFPNRANRRMMPDYYFGKQVTNRPRYGCRYSTSANNKQHNIIKPERGEYEQAACISTPLASHTGLHRHSPSDEPLTFHTGKHIDGQRFAFTDDHSTSAKRHSVDTK